MVAAQKETGVGAARRAPRQRAAGAADAARAGDATQARILAVAADLFAQNGYDATSIAMLTAQAGVPAPSIYWFFGSKENLFTTVIRDGAERFFLRARSVLEPVARAGQAVPPPIAIRTDQMLDQDPNFLRCLLRVGLSPERAADPILACIREVRAEARRLMVEICRPLLAGLAPEIAEPMLAAFSDMMLALADGSFIARTLDAPPAEAAGAPPAILSPLLLRAIQALATQQAAQSPAANADPKADG